MSKPHTGFLRCSRCGTDLDDLDYGIVFEAYGGVETVTLCNACARELIIQGMKRSSGLIRPAGDMDKIDADLLELLGEKPPPVMGG